MDVVEVVKAMMLMVGGGVLVLCFSLARTVRRADPNEYRNAKLLSGGLGKVLRGRVDGFQDGIRDPRVKAGLAIDKKNNKWVPHGALSKDTIDNVFS